MTRKSEYLRVPLMAFSGVVERLQRTQEIPPGLRWVSDVEISTQQDLPEGCFALEFTDKVNILLNLEKAFGVFGPGKQITPLNGIYALGLERRAPLFCKVIKDDSLSNNSRPNRRRKSFMTPTPLHIPESRVSPIPDSSHEMMYLNDLNEKENLKIVPLKEIVWMCPLILVMENPDI
ncbi:MAG: hypothetical protein OEZ51_05980 [Nitrospinota bacterium]|nr:hypothetical protein [Nitrospinota bacterium]